MSTGIGRRRIFEVGAGKCPLASGETELRTKDRISSIVAREGL